MKTLNPSSSLNRLRQAIVAVLIVALVLTALPLAERLTPPAQAQGVFPCGNYANRIFQNCKLGSGGSETELEDVVINDLLAVHKLPASERSRLLGWERGKIRAGIFGRIVGYINKPAAERSADEQAIVTALTNRVKARRILAATKAIDEFHRWQVTCPYNPPAPFPPSNAACTGIGLRAVPTFEQFQAYGAVLASSEFQDAELNRVLTDTAVGFAYISSLVGSSLALTAASAFLWSSVVVGTFFAWGTESTLVVPIVLPTVVSAANTTGPIAILIYAVLTAVVGTILVIEEAQLPGKLDEAKQNAENSTPNLAQMLTTDIGRREIFGELAFTTLPDFPATSGVPAAQASDPKFENSPSGLNTFTPTPVLQYKDWEGAQHTVRMNGRWFVDRKGNEAERLTLSIQFLNWEGKKKLASRVGSQFLITDFSTDRAAPVTSTELRYVNWNSISYSARIQDSPPTVTAINVTRQIGGLGGALPQQIATVADADDPVEFLTVDVTSPLTSNNVTLSGLTVEADGKVKAVLSTSCSSTDAGFTVRVTDTRGQSAEEAVMVTVPANLPPVLTYMAAQTIAVGRSTTISPTDGPRDPDSTAYNSNTFSYVAFGLPTIRPISATAPPFAGTVSLWIDNSTPFNAPPTGKIDIANAGPIGAYRVEVPVGDGCGLRTVASFTLNVTCAPLNVLNVVKDPTCPGASNGQITVNATGATSALQYSKDNGQTFQDSNVFAGLTAGTYQIVVKDAFGCTTQGGSAKLLDPQAITLSTTPVTPTCNGASNGQITVNATGGTGALTYSINGGASFVASNIFTGLTAGAYNVVVKDANGCVTAAQALTLTQPAALSLTPAALPTAQAGIAFSQSFTAAGGTGTKTVSLSGALPNGISFTPSANGGTLAGTPLQTGTFPLTLTFTDQNNCTSTQNQTLTVVCPTVALTPTTLPSAQGGAAYSQQMSAAPAGGNYVFALTSGLLPPGLTLSPAGLLSGTPTQNGVFNFRITATGVAACSSFNDYVLNVSGCAPITLNPATLPGGTMGAAYNQTVSPSPAGAYNFSVTGGALPVGLSLNPTTGAITGAPTQSGLFNFRLAATQGSCSGARDYAVTIGCPTITLGALTGGAIGTGYHQTISVTPAGAYSFALTGGSLPAGVSLNPATGAVSGAPSAAGNYGFTIRATGAGSCATTKDYALTIACPTISLSSLATPTLKAAYHQTITATPAGSYSFAVTAGALPAGLSLNAATGVISGTPASAGAYDFTITASGFSGGSGACSGSRAYTGAIAGSSCPTITLADLSGGQPGQLYNQAATASPAGSYSYTVTSGSLPPGLTLFGSFGLIYGFPTTAGTFNFTVTATSLGDANNCTGGKAYSLQIGGAASRSLVFGDFDGDGKADLSVWRGATGQWLTLNSGDGKLKTEIWGTSAAPYFDVMTPGDYDGDGRMDLAVFRKSTGEWFIKGSRDGAVTTKLWGLGTDVPVPGDYDGDGKTDIAVWRGADTNWYIVRSSDGQVQTVSWGTNKAPYNDVPAAADFDGDGKTDIAVFRQANDHWYIRRSSDGAVVDKAWGLGTDVPVAADYDGDGKADIAVWRGSEGNWYIIRSSDGAAQSVSWGSSAPGDVPAPTDYDGDGKADVTVWRVSSGVWFVKTSSNGAVMSKAHGQTGDTPVINKP